jgi:hypothetical protein
MLHVNTSWKCLTCVPFHVALQVGLGSFCASEKRCTYPSGLQISSPIRVMIHWIAFRNCLASRAPSICNQFWDFEWMSHSYWEKMYISSNFISYTSHDSLNCIQKLPCKLSTFDLQSILRLWVNVTQLWHHKEQIHCKSNMFYLWSICIFEWMSHNYSPVKKVDATGCNWSFVGNWTN